MYPKFPKIHRLFRECFITEKIDGTNGLVAILEPDAFPEAPALATRDGLRLCAGSRSRWLSPADDNYGFAEWVQNRAESLFDLGAGLHYGEFWGPGINRGYGVSERRFSLFQGWRWHPRGSPGREIADANPKNPPKFTAEAPVVCDVVPVLYQGAFNELYVARCLAFLHECGSFAHPGYLNPEGIVVYHRPSNTSFKVLLENDDQPKGASERS